MFLFLGRRIWQSVPSIVGVLVLVFFVSRLAPGDPASLILGEYADPKDLENLRTTLGLNKPLFIQFKDYFLALLSGNFGISVSRDLPVTELFFGRLGNSLLLAFSSLCVTAVMVFFFGYWGQSRNRFFPIWVPKLWALFASGVPMFVLAPLMILFFSVEFELLPVAGLDGFSSFVLPSLCLGFVLSGLMIRVFRDSLKAELSSDYVKTARAKGLKNRQIIFSHVTKNSLIPLIAVFTHSLGSLLSGAVVTETIFDWPGVGKLLYSAFQSRDYPLIQGIVLWIALIYVAMNILADLFYALIDPRVRESLSK